MLRRGGVCAVKARKKQSRLCTARVIIDSAVFGILELCLRCGDVCGCRLAVDRGILCGAKMGLVGTELFIFDHYLQNRQCFIDKLIALCFLQLA